MTYQNILAILLFSFVNILIIFSKSTENAYVYYNHQYIWYSNIYIMYFILKNNTLDRTVGYDIVLLVFNLFYTG